MRFIITFKEYNRILYLKSWARAIHIFFYSGKEGFVKVNIESNCFIIIFLFQFYKGQNTNILYYSNTITRWNRHANFTFIHLYLLFISSLCSIFFNYKIRVRRINDLATKPIRWDRLIMRDNKSYLEIIAFSSTRGLWKFVARHLANGNPVEWGAHWCWATNYRGLLSTSPALPTLRRRVICI